MCVIKILAIILFGFCVVFASHSASLEVLQQMTTVPKTESNSLATLLDSIQNELNFSTIVFWRREPADCFTELSHLRLMDQFPQLIFNSSYVGYLKTQFNRALLNVVCLNTFVDQHLLDNMANSLQYMRETRVLFLLKNFNRKSKKNVEELFTYCDQQQILNVLAVYEEYTKTGLFYSFNRFPNFTMDTVEWPETYYPNRLSNLHGYELQTMHSQAEPGSIVYTDRKGEKRCSGYIYHLISTYAEKHNASLTYNMPLNVGASIDVSILADLTANYKLDIPICLRMPVENVSLYEFSDIVEINNWMPMLPRTGHIECYQVYRHIFHNSTLILDAFIYFIFAILYALITNKVKQGRRYFARRPSRLPYSELFFNDKIFRAVIGLPSALRQVRNYKFYLLYFLIFLQGLIWSTVYNAQLNTFASRPPTGQQINSYDDLKARHIQIAISQEEFVVLEKLMSESFMRVYKDEFLVIPELRDFYTLRKSLNPQFAYSVHSHTWTMIAQLQRYFSQSLFRISEEMQFRGQNLQAIPLAENSVFRESFNVHLLHMRAYGFWAHWTSMGLFEMTEARKLSFEDITQPLSYKALRMQDLYYIWMIYIFGNAIGCFYIIAEVLHKKFVRETIFRDGRNYFAALWRELKDQCS